MTTHAAAGSTDPGYIAIYVIVATGLFVAQLVWGRAGRPVRWPLWATTTEAGRVGVLVLYGSFVAVGLGAFVVAAA